MPTFIDAMLAAAWRRRFFLLSLTAALIALPGGSALGKPRVVATVSDLGAIAREVAGDAASVSVLSKSTQDPHFVDARPNLVLELAKADLLLHVGMELEVGWLPALLGSARNPQLQLGAKGNLNASTLIRPLEVATGNVDRSMGDIHPGGNPHYLTDPRNGVLVARGIAAKLVEIDPENAAKYRENLSRFEKAVESKVAEWEKQAASLKGAKVVTYHRSWAYFTTWLGLVTVDYVEPKPGLPPNARHVAELLQKMKSEGVKLVLQEQWYPSSTSKLLAKQTGARLVLVPGMTPEGKSYLEHIDALVKAVTGPS